MINFTVFKDVLCPLKFYFHTNLQAKEYNKQILSAIIGNIVHHIYAYAIKQKFNSFEQFCDDTYIYASISKYITPFYAHRQQEIYNRCILHLHDSFLSTLIKGKNICEKSIKSTLNILDNEYDIYLKPDILTIDGTSATIIEIKTGILNNIEKLQLELYAWIIFQNYSKVKRITTAVYSTSQNKIIILDVYNQKTINALINKYIQYTTTLYSKLKIKDISEINVKIEKYIQEKNICLSTIDDELAINLCKSCPYAVVCPSYLKEFISIFTDRFENNTKVDRIIYVNGFSYAKSDRTLFVHNSCRS